jgi:hypothetical protein
MSIWEGALLSVWGLPVGLAEFFEQELVKRASISPGTITIGNSILFIGFKAPALFDVFWRKTVAFIFWFHHVVGSHTLNQPHDKYATEM